MVSPVHSPPVTMDTPTSHTQGMQIGLPKELLRSPAAKSQTKETFNGWMASGWKRPAIKGRDTGHCCIAFWVPWEMYGKTHWRLKQVVNGGDPQDTSWQHEYRCNEACWAMLALDCLCLMSLGCTYQYICLYCYLAAQKY